ncbi:MAG TPA: MarR family transcriptional regulator [Armatimonadota bacterium]|jgi:DNA-binding MarR family transcriptional regulator
MQLLRHAKKSPAEACAEAILETLPRLNAILRPQWRRRHPADLIPLQFSALGCVSVHAGLSLSGLTEYLGLSLSATSRLVDVLVKRGYLTRETCPQDRRRAQLSVTERGAAALAAAKQVVQEELSRALAPLSAGQQQQVIEVMQVLGQALQVPPANVPSQEEKLCP